MRSRGEIIASTRRAGTALSDALDASHLAVATHEPVIEAVGDPMVFVTRDAHQRAAAEAEGVTVR